MCIRDRYTPALFGTLEEHADTETWLKSMSKNMEKQVVFVLIWCIIGAMPFLAIVLTS